MKAKKLLSWTVKGLDEEDKRVRARNLLELRKEDDICLQESELELNSSSVVRSLWEWQHVD